MRLGRGLVAQYRQRVDGRRRDCLANLQDLVLPGEQLEVAVPVSTGGQVRFYGYAGLTAERFVLCLSDHPRRRRPFEAVDGVFTFDRGSVRPRRGWGLEGRLYGFVELRTPRRSLWLRPWGEPLRPLVDALTSSS